MQTNRPHNNIAAERNAVAVVVNTLRPLCLSERLREETQTYAAFTQHWVVHELARHSGHVQGGWGGWPRGNG